MLTRKKGIWRKYLLALGISASLAFVTQTTSQAAPDQTVIEDMSEQVELLNGEKSGTHNGCKWTISEKGKLTVRSVSSNSDLSNAAWAPYKNEIVEVDIDVPYSSHLAYMFSGFNNLEKAKIKIDKTSGSAYSMFRNGGDSDTSNSKLKSLDLKGFNTSGITDMSYMFCGCKELTSLNLSGFDTSNVTKMTKMFCDCTKLSALNIGSFKTGQVITMSGMFKRCGALKSFSAAFNTYNLRSVDSMFYGCSGLTKVDLSKWDVSNVVRFTDMFNSCTKLSDVNLKGWNTQRAAYMDGMFADCCALKSLNVNHFDVSGVEWFSSMFRGCSKLTTLNLSNWKTISATSMNYMFGSCSALKNLDIRSFNTAYVTSMQYMFSYCKALTKVDLSSFRTPRLMYAEGMFYYCENLQSLDLSNFEFPKVKSQYNYDSISTLIGCSKLAMVKAPLKLEYDIRMPSTGTWYRDDKNEKIQSLPLKLKKSTWLHKQEFDNRFVDVRKPGWQYDAAEYVYDKKVMVGKAETQTKLVVFAGDVAMTRAEFVQTIYNLHNRPNATYVKGKFSDVPKGQWYTNAIMWASKAGIVSGKGNGKFGIDDKVTRQDAVSILYRYAQKTNKKLLINVNTSLTSYPDRGKVADYAAKPMQWAVGNGIISGKPSGKKNYLDPTGKTTRIECAAVLKNFMTFREKNK